jgi:uncharacterized protein (TIGR02145 family)
MLTNLKKSTGTTVLWSSVFTAMLWVSGCKKEESLPVISSTTVRYITHSSAIVAGTITDEGKWGVLEKGVCWSSTNPEPTLADSKKNSDSQTGTGEFQIPLAFLAPRTTYYIRTFARSDAGMSYGKVQQFTTRDVQYLTDARDGQQYPVVAIGTQTWMAANLNFDSPAGSVSHPDGVQIPGAGRLYTWAAACQACPSGWRLPSDQDWKLLETTLGLDARDAELTGGRGIMVGQRVKTPDYDLWSGYPGLDKVLMNQVTNDTGLSIVPGGSYDPQTNAFSAFRTTGFYWSFTAEASDKAWMRSFTDNSNTAFRGVVKKDTYFSVRCLK